MPTLPDDLRLGPVELTVRELDRAIAWYQQALGLRVHRQDIGVTRFGTPEDIGGLVAFLVSPRGRWLHGATISLDGGEVKTL